MSDDQIKRKYQKIQQEIGIQNRVCLDKREVLFFMFALFSCKSGDDFYKKTFSNRSVLRQWLANDKEPFPSVWLEKILIKLGSSPERDSLFVLFTSFFDDEFIIQPSPIKEEELIVNELFSSSGSVKPIPYELREEVFEKTAFL
jgi:hypothetical protein